MAEPRLNEGMTFAAVDLGSNSFHLIVARVQHGQVQIIDRLREMARLAAGLGKDGTLAAEARTRALEALARFGQRLGGISRNRVRALGTSTFRRMWEPREFLTAAEDSLGHPIEVVSPHEEARLVYLGVAHDLATNADNRLVVDIGGGSTEFIIGLGFEPMELGSVSRGCVSVSEEFFGDGTLTRAAFKAANMAVALELRPIRTVYRERGWEEVVGSSGTIRAIGRVLAESGWGKRGITPKGLKKLRFALEEAGKVSRLDLPGLSAERRAVFAGGVVILDTCFRNLELERMVVSEGALREGALHDLIGRARHEDPREASVKGLAARYRADGPQAARVQTTALAGFDQVAEAWGLSDADRQRLEFAARLHEIGLAVAHTQYNRHGAYLVEHGDLSGFSSEEQAVVATLILTHRRKLTPDAFGPLATRLAQPVTRICALLRLAVLLHRSRVPDAPPQIQWTADGDALTLQFPGGWLEGHPLTQADLEAEQGQLRHVGINLVCH